MSEALSKPLEPNDQKALLAACGSDFFGLRARVILELAIRFGLLEKEIHQLDLSHVSIMHKLWKRRIASRKIVIPGSDKDTPMIDTDEQFRALLDRYLSERTDFIEGNPEMVNSDAPLILSQALTRLTQRALRKALRQISHEARLGDLTFHQLRATFIHSLWKQTKDVKEVARRGRLKSAATVMRHIGIAES